MTTDSAADTVLVQRDRGVATVTLNRPEKLNALTPDMQQRYVDVLRELDADPDVRVMVVTGAGRGFCSGADLSQLTSIDPSVAEHVLDRGRLPTLAIETRKPLVAAVNGPVAGIGFALMLAADVRFIAAGTRVSTTFSRLGLVAEYGLAWLLPRAIGTGRAIEILMSGRMVDADEALRIGLVTDVVEGRPVLDRALEWAHDVADNCSPRSLAAMKEQVYGDYEHTFDEAIDDMLGRMHESFTWGDLPEALRARAESRPPSFPPLK